MELRKCKQGLFTFPGKAGCHSTQKGSTVFSTIGRMSSNRSSSRGRRIQSHERETNDEVPILGSDLQDHIDQVVTNAVHATMSKAMSTTTRRDYRNRIKRFIKHLKENFNSYYLIGVRPVTPEELADRNKYYNKNDTEDLQYTGLNVKYLIYFLSSTEKREDNGKLKSQSDARKYRDAVLWGSKMAGTPLPISFFDDMNIYIGAYSKKYAQARKKGDVDEYSTDPIPLPVYQLLLKRSIHSHQQRVCLDMDTTSMELHGS